MSIFNLKEPSSNTFSCKYTNGYTEGINNIIKVLKRNAYDVKNFKGLETKFSCHELKFMAIKLVLA